MFTYLAPVAAGNAVLAILSPPAWAKSWRVLRKATDTIAAQDDAQALVAYEGEDRSFIDIAGLRNNVQVFYRPFYWNGDAWIADVSMAVTPAVLYTDVSCDVVSLLRERLDLGMVHYVGAGKLHHKNGKIPVMNATPTYEGTAFPVVSVILASDAPAQDFVGGVVGGDVKHASGQVSSFTGHMSRYEINITAFTPNSDARAALRMALKAILTANRVIFEENQITQVEVSFTDQDDFQSYGEPMFMVRGSFTCLAPTAIEVRTGVISDVSVSIADVSVSQPS